MGLKVRTSMKCYQKSKRKFTSHSYSINLNENSSICIKFQPMRAQKKIFNCEKKNSSNFLPFSLSRSLTYEIYKNLYLFYKKNNFLCQKPLKLPEKNTHSPKATEFFSQKFSVHLEKASRKLSLMKFSAFHQWMRIFYVHFQGKLLVNDSFKFAFFI